MRQSVTSPTSAGVTVTLTRRLQVFQRPRDRVAVVEDDLVGDQVVVLDDLDLIVARVLGDGVSSTEVLPCNWPRHPR